jgi:hypothetical protein
VDMGLLEKALEIKRINEEKELYCYMINSN